VSKAREFIDFWIGNSVHAAEPHSNDGATQDASELSQRLVEAAESQGVSEAELQAEIGDISNYIRDKLRAVNRAENDRPKT
jgi:hypothetical protein